MPAQAVDEDMSGLQIFVDQAALMHPTDARGDEDGEFEKRPHIDRLSEAPIEWLASRILENKYCPLAIPNQL
jgi:hypothetical protein